MTSSRREWIQSLCGGLGSIGLIGMLAGQKSEAATLGHYAGTAIAPKAKHVIFLFLTGGPSQLDMFDPKPNLAKYQGQRPDAVSGFRTERETGGLLPSPFTFRKYGRNGVDVSELLPQTASVIDDICVIRSMYTFNPTHTQGKNLAHSGSILANRPSLGAWVSYGLGTENENLPAFVVLSPNPDSGSLWRAGFLPSEFQGVPFNTGETDPEKMIRDLRNRQMDAKSQRKQLDLVQSMNSDFLKSWGQDSLLEGRIKAMESAYRVQFEALDVFDVRKETPQIREEYGDNSWGNSCLLARRLVERGVRYVHLYPSARDEAEAGVRPDWDDHKDIFKSLRSRCPNMDRAAAALIRDLKRRGLLDETLVVWGGEFGRTPVSEAGDGRDHDPYGYTMWLAGGGVKGGIAYGATDEFGFKAVENRVSIHDLHATILYLLGMDHEKLTYRYAGRDFRLTDVYGEIVKPIIA
jgi:predicted nuclease with RNAse H fold